MCLNSYKREVKMSKITEDIDVTPAPDLFHKSKQDLLKDPIDVEQLMPDLGPQAQRYIELVTSESYKKVVERLKACVRVPIGNNPLPQLMGIVMNALQQVGQIQRGHEKELEKVALDVIFELEEFKLFKDMMDAGIIKFDVKLDTPDLSNAITKQDIQPQETEEELSNVEQMNVELADQFKDPNIIKRKFANMITQGNAVNKLYLYNLVSEKLNQINPNLVNLYGILTTVVQISYYALPNMQFSKEMVEAVSAGSVEVVPTNKIYTIKARSAYFPYLIHEIVKGMYDYLSIDLVSQQELNNETIDDEVLDIISGPDLYTRLVASIPSNKAKLIPIIYKLLLQQEPDMIKSVLLGGNAAKNVMNPLISQAQEMIDDFTNDSEDKWED